MTGRTLLRDLRRLRPAEALPAMEAAWILSAVRWGLRRLRWPVLLRLLRVSAALTRSPRRGRPGADPTAAVLTAMGRAGRSRTQPPSCLEEALSVQWMLRRRHVETQVRIGVAKDGAGGLRGHAWAERGGSVVSVDPFSPARYALLTGPLDGQLDELHRRHLSL